MLDFRETVGFAVFLAGVGLGVVITLPAVLLMGILSGVIRLTLHVGVRGDVQCESIAERRAREYWETAQRG